MAGNKRDRNTQVTNAVIPVKSAITSIPTKGDKAVKNGIVIK